jgi:hypothetical protein
VKSYPINEELHHHEVFHFALNMITRAMNTEEADDMFGQLRDHLSSSHDRGPIAPSRDFS